MCSHRYSCSTWNGENRKKNTAMGEGLDIIDIQIAVIVPELERALAVLLAERVGLVDLGVLRQLAVRFH